MSQNKSKVIITPIKDFKPENLTYSKFIDSSKQKISFVSYKSPIDNKETQLYLQTDWIELTQGGIPKFHDEYYPDDRKRSRIQIPFEKTDIIFKKMEGVQNILDSKEFKKNMFGEGHKKYKIKDFVRVPDASTDPNKPTYLPSMTIRFKLAYTTDKPSDSCEIITSVFNSTLNETGNKRVREQISTGETKTKVGNDTRTVKYISFEKIKDSMPYRSKVRIILSPSKLWCSGNKDYSLVWSAIKIEVQPSEQDNSRREEFKNDDTFMDSDSDEEKDDEKDEEKDDDDKDSDADSDADSVKPKSVKDEDEDENKDSDDESTKAESVEEDTDNESVKAESIKDDSGNDTDDSNSPEMPVAPVEVKPKKSSKDDKKSKSSKDDKKSKSSKDDKKSKSSKDDKKSKSSKDDKKSKSSTDKKSKKQK